MNLPLLIVPFGTDKRISRVLVDDAVLFDSSNKAAGSSLSACCAATMIAPSRMVSSILIFAALGCRSGANNNLPST